MDCGLDLEEIIKDEQDWLEIMVENGYIRVFDYSGFNEINEIDEEEMVPGTPSIYAKLYKKCWNTNPKRRPELEEILRKIQQSREAAEEITNCIS
ncbi:14439_t:CDS:2 [Racocetra fulgida]|uniref:14439_t:CDS:1 n=1 Tax=Racocetra fulgida TaxID=60492 RepID=A0A9N8VW18_9GLOM|nr:14439_t:CDS:2 [Racocetra fulgida]